MNMNRLISVILATLIVVWTFESQAHHGANTNPELYLAENLLELDGEISEFCGETRIHD